MQKNINLFSLGCLLLAFSAEAVPSSYCRKVQARAAADAAVLMSPQLVAQALRAPQYTLLDPGNEGGSGVYQLRAGLSFSPLDFYKGLSVMSVSDADCERHHAQRNIEELLQQVHDIGKLPALQRQIDYLLTQREQWQLLQRVAAERLAVRAITIMDFNELEKKASSLERRIAEQQGESERIAARNYPNPAADMSALAAAYGRTTHAYEREVTASRALSAWKFRLSGGVIPLQFQPRSASAPLNRVDWYAFAELSLNLGVLSSFDQRYLEARQEEVETAPYELVDMLARFRKEAQARLAQARRELESVERQAVSTGSTLHLLQRSETPNSAHAVALLRLDEIWLAAEKLYLAALADELTQLLDAVPILSAPGRPQ